MEWLKNGSFERLNRLRKIHPPTPNFLLLTAPFWHPCLLPPPNREKVEGGGGTDLCLTKQKACFNARVKVTVFYQLCEFSLGGGIITGWKLFPLSLALLFYVHISFEKSRFFLSRLPLEQSLDQYQIFNPNITFRSDKQKQFILKHQTLCDVIHGCIPLIFLWINLFYEPPMTQYHWESFLRLIALR